MEPTCTKVHDKVSWPLPAFQKGNQSEPIKTHFQAIIRRPRDEKSARANSKALDVDHAAHTINWRLVYNLENVNAPYLNLLKYYVLTK